MVEMNRRKLLGTAAGAAGAAAVAGAALTPAAQAAAKFGATGASAPVGPHPHVFSLTKAKPNTFSGGDLRGAHEEDFPILKGQNASVYMIHLDVDGVREPHWHPTAWELTYVMSGKVRWTILGAHPTGKYEVDSFTAETGDLVFIPQGFFHYFENASSTERLQVLVLFNTSSVEPNDDIGIVGSLNAIPRDVLGAVFGVPASAFHGIPTEVKPVVIAKKKR
ncbi:cupin domain-containing protein [Streptoalloteichus hindustanus]|uniref:Oxalate decarboxylase n=1 Tax=Streptoalloteichus hindustanus TaxID=2017 RepID=A0A1M5NC01_STRHI|nr:cupin domain-containing protein [Streptoalloteichus hindustanus]SHG86982.1 oxalate decarboxylase [Streptoalloteichus hindustanus]